MTRRSSELAAVMRRMIGAFEAKDAETVRGLISQSDDTLMVGTDAREWLYGVEAFEVTAAQVADAPAYRWSIRRLEAFEEGSVGWVAADTTVQFEDGPDSDARVTAVFRLEGGVWRVVQWHASAPAPIFEPSDWEVPMSLADLTGSGAADIEQLLRAHYRAATVTFLFSDIQESTSLAIQAGDVVWADVVQRHFADVRRIADAHSGFVVKTLGDGVMLAFDSAGDAVGAAAAIQRVVANQRVAQPFQVRIGVHSGDALRVDADYSGHAVNLTARLASAATGDQVLVSEVVRGLVGDSSLVRFGDAIRLTLKGIAEPITAFPLVPAD